MRYILKKLAPAPLLSLYHYILAFTGAFLYRFPSRKIYVVGVTGTKGKTTVVELVNAILEEAGYKTALVNTIRFKVGDSTERNMLKMTMPGRFFLQRFLRRAVREKCDYAILEMTSEGVKQYRHKWIALDALIFTNLSPEHIESHGSYEAYRDAKLEIAASLQASPKKERTIIANSDDKEGEKFLAVDVEKKLSFSLKDAGAYRLSPHGSAFFVQEKEVPSPLLGEFNLYNILAAVTFVKSQNIAFDAIKEGIKKCSGIPGRLESIEEGQDFAVIVDYAHTPDSLIKVYKLFRNLASRGSVRGKNLCVLGAAGGGRDTWKRKEFGRIAEQYCEKIILTNEDPYDEDQEQIIQDIAKGFPEFHGPDPKYLALIDRREAIRQALKEARKDDIVLITGKGTDPFIMGPKGSKIPWDDRSVARQELRKLLEK